MESREAAIDAAYEEFLRQEAPSHVELSRYAVFSNGYNAGYAAASQDRAWVPFDLEAGTGLPTKDGLYIVSEGDVHVIDFWNEDEKEFIDYQHERGYWTPFSPYVPTKGENE